MNRVAGKLIGFRKAKAGRDHNRGGVMELRKWFMEGSDGLSHPTPISRGFFAPTAEDDPETRLPESNWQSLGVHLRHVAALAKKFAEPFDSFAQAEIELAGSLHDLGKYSQRFQNRLPESSIHGVNHWDTLPKRQGLAMVAE